ncbi:unnamed protein product [Calicophoron daubneyi]|uniref:Presenilin n=1 Tax=Calicophoron daubneyi TaxID=300641 RepID=A0AAV2TMD9_CALDB
MSSLHDSESQHPPRSPHNDNSVRLDETGSRLRRSSSERNRCMQGADSVSRYSTDSFSPDEILAFGAKHIISLFVPVTVCMFFVVTVASTVDFYAHTDQYLIYTPFHTPDADLGTRTWQTLANTLIFMSIIVVMTCVLVLLFKYRCYKFIRGWLILTTFFLLFLISFIFFTQVVRAMGIFVDYITMSLIVWNFGVAGMLAIHWRGPLLLQQAYLIFVSAQIALLFLKYLPKWTCWVLLGALAVWDLVAVLCPRGPLRMLVEMAHERQEPLFPALLYSTTAAYLVIEGDTVQKSEDDSEGLLNVQNSHSPSLPSGQPSAVNTANSVLSVESFSTSATPDDRQNPEQLPLVANTTENNQTPALEPNERMTPSPHLGSLCRRRRVGPSSRSGSHSSGRGNVPHENAETDSVDRWREVQADLRDREERGVKLGLGDFVFYSLLIGRAALDGDSITIAACYVAILVGMCVTLIVLGITRRALPALPISIACGILFYFVTSAVISPFLEVLATQRLFF